MATPSFKSGKLAGITVGGTPLPLVQYEITPQTDTAEFINSMSGTDPILDATFTRYNITIQVDMDFNNDFELTSPSIGPGSLITSPIKLFRQQSAQGNYDGPGWLVPQFQVTSLPETVPVNGKPTLRITGRGFGGVVRF